MKILYTAHATTISGRNGYSETDDKQLSVKLSAPGSNKPGTNPEQLFAAGYSACFGSAVEGVAKKHKIAISEIKVQAAVNLNQDDDGGYFISVILDVTLPGVDDETAKKIIDQAHEGCPYSKATRGNIDVILNIKK